jgi:UDP-N-acetylglucosamine 1-carboxyvinyltransferase
MVTENVYDNRFKYAAELKRMGADITVDGKVAVIKGVERLTGAVVKATDLRAGAAMVLAGLVAKGTTEISEIYHIERGYENFVGKFKGLGADIMKIEQD